MSMPNISELDIADFIDDEKDAAEYLSACFELGDSALIKKALGDIARAEGITEMSRMTGVSRDGLYKALSENGNPSFELVMKVVKALGLKLKPMRA